jgi:hypothetical protein
LYCGVSTPLSGRLKQEESQLLSNSNVKRHSVAGCKRFSKNLDAFAGLNRPQSGVEPRFPKIAIPDAAAFAEASGTFELPPTGKLFSYRFPCFSA